ncbi:MAG: glycosyltransferase family 2 protein, partial [Bacteroidales bacterium]|nr:glycosyltransferase family 2 protein [Bacteroidales bacterium]
MKRIDCIIPFKDDAQAAPTLQALAAEAEVHDVIGASHPLEATVTWKSLVSVLEAPYTLVYTKFTPLRLGVFSLERMLSVAEDTGAVMVYADHFQERTSGRIPAPVIDYQEGSLRDQFDFGSVLLYKTSVLKEAVAGMDADYQYAALYDLRLR